MARKTAKAATDVAAEPVEAEQVQAEETAVTEAAPPVPPAEEMPVFETKPTTPKNPVAKRPPAVASSDMVWVKLVGIDTAVINHQAILRDEIMQLSYVYYTQVRAEYPGCIAVKLPGSSKFVVE